MMEQAAGTRRYLTPDLERQYRDAINPVYADVLGTESFERRVLLDEIVRLRGLLADEKDEVELKQACIKGISHNTERIGFALENCRLLAARNRKEDWAREILRFCAEAGVEGSALRGKS